MNYVFDVCLNFNQELYEFYEWNKEDDVLYFLKIPVFRIEEDLIDDFIKNDIKVDNIFLKKIYNKSQIYFKKNKKTYEYSCIITSSKKCIGISFNNNGYVIGKSNLSLEEESEVIEFSKFIKYSLINYKVIRRYNSKTNYSTRKEKNDIKYIKKYLNDLDRDKKTDELKYLYYEIFNNQETNMKKMKQKLEVVLSSNDKKRDTFLEIIRYFY